MNDCDLIVNNIENTFSSLENSLETVIDDRKSKMHVVESIFGFGKSLTMLTLNLTSCAIKNAPKLAVAVAATKREVIEAGTNDWNQYQKELKKEALYEKIKQLKPKQKTRFLS